MSLEDNKSIIRRFLEECVIQGNMEVYDTFFSPHLAAHSYGNPPHSHASYRVLVEQYHQAFSGHTLTIDDLIAEGDKVAAHISYTATAHQAPLGKNLPTGLPIEYELALFFDFEQGKVVKMLGIIQGVDLDFSQ